jgi:hypothetical protein
LKSQNFELYSKMHPYKPWLKSSVLLHNFFLHLNSNFRLVKLSSILTQTKNKILDPSTCFKNLGGFKYIEGPKDNFLRV